MPALPPSVEAGSAAASSAAVDGTAQRVAIAVIVDVGRSPKSRWIGDGLLRAAVAAAVALA